MLLDNGYVGKILQKAKIWHLGKYVGKLRATLDIDAYLFNTEVPIQTLAKIVELNEVNAEEIATLSETNHTVASDQIQVLLAEHNADVIVFSDDQVSIFILLLDYYPWRL